MPKSKKFFDIVPPKKLKERPLSAPSFKEKKIAGVEIQQRPRSFRPFSLKGFFWQLKPSGKLTILIVVLLIIAGIFCQFVLVKAKIVIWPETEIVNFAQEITLDSKANQVSCQEKIIPGKVFEVDQFTTQEFPTSGKTIKEEKATGQIRVYNAYSTYPQVLVAQTRFISDDGKLFRSTKKVTIPGGRYEESNVLLQRRLVPSYLDIEVVAAEPGEDYNIGPSTFSIPGFAGTPRYTAFYGKSFSPMEGGFLGEAPELLQEDLDRAESVLIESLKKETKDSLKLKLPEEFVLLEEGISYEILESSSLAKVGAEVETFVFRVKMKTKGIGFKKTSLENFAKEFINLNIPETKKIQDESLKTSYLSRSINLSAGKAILDLEFGAKIFADIDFTSLRRATLGKSLREAQILLKNQPQITKASIEVFPFWLKKIPQQEEKIEIELRVD